MFRDSISVCIPHALVPFHHMHKMCSNLLEGCRAIRISSIELSRFFSLFRPYIPPKSHLRSFYFLCYLVSSAYARLRLHHSHYISRFLNHPMTYLRFLGLFLISRLSEASKQMLDLKFQFDMNS